MKTRWYFAVLAATLVAAELPARASEPMEAFLQGLRQRGYYDTAEEYLNRLAEDPSTPADVKRVLSYHRAVVLTDAAYNKRNGDEQQRFFDLAVRELDSFVSKNPGHPLLGDAEMRRGKIYIGKTEAYILQIRSAKSAPDLRKLALESTGNARKAFTKAVKIFEARWRAFPLGGKNPAREKAEVDFMLAQIELAKVTYEEAQVYDPKHKKYKELLTQASKEFEKISFRYRSQIAGLLAKMWQGKCWEEQGEIGRAIGIYGQLLEHESTQKPYLNLKRQVLHFKLICLNKRKEYALVEQDATNWLKRNRGAIQNTRVGLGIRYQLAVARENFAARKGLAEAKKKEYLRQAQADAQFINRFPGKYKDVTTIMLARIRHARGLDTKDPENFADAFSAAEVAMKSFSAKRQAVLDAEKSGATEEKKAALLNEQKDSLPETIRLFRLAMKLARPDSKPAHVFKTRETLAYLYYQESLLHVTDDHLYDAAVLANFVARNAKTVSPDSAANAAKIALACFGRLYDLAPRGQRDTETRWITDFARFVTDSWPGTKASINATNNLGMIFQRRGQHLIAARWYAAVPASARDDYPVAQIDAGQQFWMHFVMSSAKQPNRQTVLYELRNNVGQRWADAAADLMAPAWGKLQRLKRQGPVLAAVKAEPGAKKQPQPDADDIPAAQKAAMKQMKAAVAELTGKPAATFNGRDADNLHKLLLQTLNRRTQPELERLFDRKLQAMDDAALKAHFQEKLEQWRILAAAHLQNGVRLLQKKTPAKSPTPAALTAGKVTLAQFVLGEGGYQQVVDLLTASPHAVKEAIKVADESQRPNDSSVKGRRFAAFTYQLLARGYIGIRKLDEFQAAMKKLEAVSSGDDARNVTKTYETLGKQLQREFERLKAQGLTERLNQERKNFKWIVDELFMHKDQLQYNTLIWIAESSYGIGEGVGEAEGATEYFKQAADAYQQVLDSGIAGKNADEKKRRRWAVLLRLANCRRRQQEFQTAVDIALRVVKEDPKQVRPQVEAALAYQDWGINKDPQHLLTAIGGDEKRGLWGWAGVARKLRRTLDALQGPGRPSAPQLVADYEQRYLQARYYITWARLQYGLAQSDDVGNKKRQLALKNAVRELRDLAMTFGVIEGKLFEDPNTRQQVNAKEKFDALYRDVQLALGRKEPAALTWTPPQAKQPVNPPGKGKAPAVVLKDATKTDASGTKTADDSGSGLGTLFAALFAVVILAGGGWFIYGMSRKPKRPRYSYGSSAPVFPGGSRSRGKAAASGKKSGGAKRPAGSSATATKQRPAKQTGTRPKRPPTEKPG